MSVPQAICRLPGERKAVQTPRVLARMTQTQQGSAGTYHVAVGHRYSAYSASERFRCGNYAQLYDREAAMQWSYLRVIDLSILVQFG